MTWTSVAISVVRPLERDDRLQVRRAELGHLDRREGAVADAPHPDRALHHGWAAALRPPRTRRVSRFGVLVEGDAAGRSGPADVHPTRHTRGRRTITASTRVGVAPPVVLAVGDHLEDRRDRTSGRAASAGRQMFADSSMPSRTGIRTSRWTAGSRVGWLPAGHWRDRSGHRMPSLRAGVARHRRRRPSRATMPAWMSPRPSTAVSGPANAADRLRERVDHRLARRRDPPGWHARHLRDRPSRQSGRRRRG